MNSRPADLLAAARLLVEAFVSIKTSQQSHKFLRQLNEHFDDCQFPALLKLFCIVGESDDIVAKKLLARGLAAALERGDMMSSFLPAWGRSDFSSAPLIQMQSAEKSAAHPSTRSQSRLDLLQYLCAWHCQRTSFTPISAAEFRKSLASLLEVFTADAACVAIYRQKLADDLATLPEGALSTLARQKLAKLLELLGTARSCADIAGEVAETGSSQARLADLARAQILKR
jgi:hypothetical protein